MTLFLRRPCDVDSIIEAIVWVFELIIPDKDPRYRRVQRLGCFLFGGFGLLVLVLVLFQVFGGR
jgi:hypothetical protein